jgi:hypothetical protein
MNDELFRFPEPPRGAEAIGAARLRSRERRRRARLAAGAAALVLGVGTAGLGLAQLGSVGHESPDSAISQSQDGGVAPPPAGTGQAPAWSDDAGEHEAD